MRQQSKLFKRLTSLAVIAAMTAVTLSGCGSGKVNEEPTKGTQAQTSGGGTVEAGGQSGAESADPYGAFTGVDPLAEKTALSIGALSSSTHGFSNILIQKLGGYDYANIDANIVVFGSGPIMVEAMASGACDCGTYGVGGTLAGTIGQGIINLGAASRDYHALQFYAPNDSPIVAAGKNIPECPELYGTVDTWRGQEIFLPVGTTLHYTLNKALEKFGLTSDDVVLTHMDVPNINTALRAGKCEVGALWTNYPYGDINDDFTPVIKASDVGVVLVTDFVATPGALGDGNKSEAVKKWMELYFAAVDWMYASDENLQQAITWFEEWNEENGISSVRSEIEAHCTYQRCYTLEENYQMFHTMSENGDYSQIVEFNYDPLKFFVEQGNYTQEDLQTFMKPEYFNSSFVDELYEMKK